MKNEHINRLEGEIKKIPEDEKDKLGRLIGVLKISLLEFEGLKTAILSQDEQLKKNSVETTQWLLQQIEDEFKGACRKTGLEVPNILALLYQSDKLTPQECQLYLQAQATIMQNRKLVYGDKTKSTNAKPKKQKLRI